MLNCFEFDIIIFFSLYKFVFWMWYFDFFWIFIKLIIQIIDSTISIEKQIRFITILCVFRFKNIISRRYFCLFFLLSIYELSIIFFVFFLVVSQIFDFFSYYKTFFFKFSHESYLMIIHLLIRLYTKIQKLFVTRFKKSSIFFFSLKLRFLSHVLIFMIYCT